MSNSSLISVTMLSPFKNSPRNHVIDTITIHCAVGQLQLHSLANCFQDAKRQVSCNYCIATDGRIALIVDEKNRSWCSSSRDNDHRAITIECASDKNPPYAINAKVRASLINLCADICKRNGIKELKWQGDKKLIGQVDKQNITVHRWFASTACPGDYIYNDLGNIAKEVNALLKAPTTTTKQKEFMIRASADNIYIRTGPGTDKPYTGKNCPKGVYTIVQTSAGTGSKSGWGKLKSGAGWINLDLVKRL